MRIAVVASCAAALSADLAAPAVAQTYETLYRACYSSGLPERVIASCSVLISRRLAVGQDLATAFKNRCNAYDDNGDHIRAIADFGAALAINAEDADAFNSRGTTSGTPPRALTHAASRSIFFITAPCRSAPATRA